MTGPAPAEYGWWLASRAAGIVALTCVAASVVLGLMMAGKVMQKPGRARKLVAIHEHTALAGLIATAVHGLTLLGDSFFKPGLAGIAVPFVVDYRPAFTGAGIVAGWLAAALGLSFYARRRIGPRLWRKLHRATILVFVLAVVHTAGAGSDAQAPWLQAYLVATSAVVLFLLIVRVLKPSRAPRRPAAPATSPHPPPAPATADGRA